MDKNKIEGARAGKCELRYIQNTSAPNQSKMLQGHEFLVKITHNFRICMIMYVFAFAFGLLLTSMFDPTIFINFSSSHVKSNAWRPGPNTRSVFKNYLDMAGN